MSDVEKTVTAIQGNPVKREILGSDQDGQVLTWVGSDEKWEAQPTAGLRKVYLTSSGTWTCPAGVTNVLIIAAGGGGGGGAAYDVDGTNGAGGGSGAIQVTSSVSVTPGTTYSITIGTGGTAGNIGSLGGLGGPGGTTIFDSLFYAVGGSGGVVGETVYIGYVASNYTNGGVNNYNTNSNYQVACGGTTLGPNNNGPVGQSNWSGNGNYTGGNGGSLASGASGGGGGGAGPQGNGAFGADAVASGTGNNGSSASSNTGAGGGGGGGTGGAGAAGGNGGSGGSGYLYIIY